MNNVNALHILLRTYFILFKPRAFSTCFVVLFLAYKTLSIDRNHLELAKHCMDSFVLYGIFHYPDRFLHYLVRKNDGSVYFKTTSWKCSRFRLIGPPVNRVSCLIGPNCEERNPIKDNALC